MSRRSGLTIQYTVLGSGEVNTVMQRDTLLLPDRAYYVGPTSPSAINCRLLNGVARPRYGYRTIGDTPTSSAVTGLFQATFDNNTAENLRGDAAAVRYLVSNTTWTSISATGVGGQWTFAMVARAGSVSPANQVMLSSDGDSDSVWRYIGNGTAASKVGDTTGGSGSGFRGARAIVGHRGRSLVMNTFDMGVTARKIKRVNYSIVGDPATHTGFGSGFVDLNDDPFPITGARVIAGNVCVFCGNNIAGSIIVGTQTGVTNNPYRWDTINTDNEGLLVPRSLVQITSNLAFYLSHGGFRLYDGARGIAHIADGIGRDILTRINPNALKTGFAWYKPQTSEIYLNLAMGSALLPNEAWVFNFEEKRVYGPYTFAHTLTAAAPYATTDTVTWDTSVGTWDTNAYGPWDTIGGLASARAVMLGASTGTTWVDDENVRTDGGSPVNAVYTFAPVRASGRALVMPDGTQRPLEEDGYLTLRDVTLTYRNQGAWIPRVEVSIDGGLSYSVLASGVSIGSDTTNLDRSLTAPYTPDGLSGTWFQLRVTGAPPMELLGARMEFGYGGNARND